MQTVDLGGGRGWLDAPAAASLLRVDRQIGHRLQITEAGRTGERQAYLHDGWVRRLPGFNYAAPRGESPHEAGNAIDTNERLVAVLAEHGWWRPLSFEPWHFVYRASHDQHRNDPAPTGTPATKPPTPQEDTDMGMQTIRDKERGSISFADEFGSDPADAYRTVDIGAGEYLAAEQKVFGKPMEVTAREWDIANAIARRRWEQKKKEIVAALVPELVKALKERG